MKRLVVLLCCALPLVAAPVEEKETITKSFLVLPGSEVVVDNVFGSIRTKAVPGNELRAVVRKRLRAENEEQAAAARRDVRLEAAQEGGTVRFFVDGPWRNKERLGGHRDYEVAYDFELEVPRDARLRLKTVMGSVSAAGPAAFEVESVNGAVEVTEAAGPGNVRTVNGRVRASFARNPQSACTFKTVNGAVEVELQPGLSADLHVSTLHGAVSTDYPLTPTPEAASAPEVRDGKFIYRPKRTTRFRAGAGGPELRFQTVNGSVQITSRGI